MSQKCSYFYAAGLDTLYNIKKASLDREIKKKYLLYTNPICIEKLI